MVVTDGYVTLNPFPTTGVLEEITLNNATIFGGATATVNVANLPNFTGFYGSGTIFGEIFAAASPNFSTVSSDISLKAGPTTSNSNIRIEGGLTADSVNHILVSSASSRLTSAFAGRHINLSGGTSAGTSALTAAGIAARNALVAAGWVVTLNA
jgi:hypothetical protein